VIDGGVTWVNNQHGGSAFLFSGMLSPDMLTFGGSDDLGGDNKAIFELTSQLDPGSGATIPDPGQIFCRTALIGLAHDRLGTLTFGEQYDFLFETLTLGRYDGAFLLGIYGYRQGPFSALGVPNNPTGSFDFDRMAGATRVGNWVK
jgi:predicted porin